MPSCANHPTKYTSRRVSGDIMWYPFCDLYSHELKKGELLSKTLLYELEHITTKVGKLVVMISFSQPYFRRLKAK